MRIGVSMPNHQSWVIRFASLFKDHTIVLAGRSPHWGEFFNFDVSERWKQWQKLANIEWLNVPYNEIDPYQFDVFVDRLDTLRWNRGWHKQQWDIPRVIRAGWAFPRNQFLLNHARSFPSAPVAVEAHSHLEPWHKALGKNVQLIYNSAGRWWQGHRWVGNKQAVLGVVIGAKTPNPRNNRNKHRAGVDMWGRVTNDLDAYMHDAYQDGFLSDVEMIDMFRQHRCFLECTRECHLDGRAFTSTIIEAMTVGMPCVAHNARGGDYKRILEEWSLKDETSLRTAVVNLLKDYELAKEVGERNYQKAQKLFSPDVLQEQWLDLFEGAI